jgi:hypothetical protein
MIKKRSGISKLLDCSQCVLPFRLCNLICAEMPTFSLRVPCCTRTTPVGKATVWNLNCLYFAAFTRNHSPGGQQTAPHVVIAESGHNAYFCWLVKYAGQASGGLNLILQILSARKQRFDALPWTQMSSLLSPMFSIPLHIIAHDQHSSISHRAVPPR